MNKRLKQLLESTQMGGKQTCLLDAYNQRIYTDVAPTISTRVDASNNTYIMEVIPLNPYNDGTARTIKAQYQQSSLANFKRQDGLGATGVLCVENKSTDTTICLNSKVDGKQPSLEDRIYSIERVMTACTTSFHPNIAIPQSTKQGFIEVEPGGVFDGAYPKSTTRRGRVQEGGKVAPTLCTSNELCVYEGVKEEDWKTIVGSMQMNSFRGGVENECSCITSSCGTGGGMIPMVSNAELEATKTKEFIEQMRGHKPLEYRIRKLTPRECFRLMGVSEENIDTIQAAGISNSQQYKMAGNSIVVDVLYYIFKKMFVDKESEKAELTLF